MYVVDIVRWIVICEMHFVREIWLRHVKCAAAREGFISFHIATAGCNISQFSHENYFTFGIAEYFTIFALPH